MNKQGHETTQCRRCWHHKYSSSIMWSSTFGNTWVYDWAMHACQFGRVNRVYMCKGCTRVSINQALVLATTLFKLDINPVFKVSYKADTALYTISNCDASQMNFYLNYKPPKILNQYIKVNIE